MVPYSRLRSGGTEPISRPDRRERPEGRQIGRKIGWLLSILLLVITGVLGIQNGIADWPDAATPLQKSVTGGVFLYGLLGLAGAVGLALRRRWTFPLVVAWGIVVTYVPGTAVMAYAPDGTWGAALTASGATALIALGVAWATRANTSAYTQPLGVRRDEST